MALHGGELVSRGWIARTESTVRTAVARFPAVPGTR